MHLNLPAGLFRNQPDATAVFVWPGRVENASAIAQNVYGQEVERVAAETQTMSNDVAGYLRQVPIDDPRFAAAFAKMSNRLRTFACTSSIGPGATNMVTGAAMATINRLPVLLLPGDIFARRNVGPVLQQLESFSSASRTRR